MAITYAPKLRLAPLWPALAALGVAAILAVLLLPRTLTRVARQELALELSLLERAQNNAPVLLTGREPPSMWKTSLPDLASRFSALLAFPLWAPDDELLAAIARKLFNDRQLAVPDAVIARMVTSLERSPAAMRDFVAQADERALAEGRPINLAMVRDMLAESGR